MDSKLPSPLSDLQKTAHREEYITRMGSSMLNCALTNDKKHHFLFHDVSLASMELLNINQNTPLETDGL